MGLAASTEGTLSVALTLGIPDPEVFDQSVLWMILPPNVPHDFWVSGAKSFQAATGKIYIPHRR